MEVPSQPQTGFKAQLRRAASVSIPKALKMSTSRHASGGRAVNRPVVTEDGDGRPGDSAGLGILYDRSRLKAVPSRKPVASTSRELDEEKEGAITKEERIAKVESWDNGGPKENKMEDEVEVEVEVEVEGGEKAERRRGTLAEGLGLRISQQQRAGLFHLPRVRAVVSTANIYAGAQAHARPRPLLFTNTSASASASSPSLPLLSPLQTQTHSHTHAHLPSQPQHPLQHRQSSASTLRTPHTSSPRSDTIDALEDFVNELHRANARSLSNSSALQTASRSGHRTPARTASSSSISKLPSATLPALDTPTRRPIHSFASLQRNHNIRGFIPDNILSLTPAPLRTPSQRLAEFHSPQVAEAETNSPVVKNSPAPKPDQGSAVLSVLSVLSPPIPPPAPLRPPPPTPPEAPILPTNTFGFRVLSVAESSASREYKQKRLEYATKPRGILHFFDFERRAFFQLVSNTQYVCEGHEICTDCRDLEFANLECKAMSTAIPPEERQKIIAGNRALRNIKNELDTLSENGFITDEALDQILSSLPAENSFKTAGRKAPVASPPPEIPVDEFRNLNVAADAPPAYHAANQPPAVRPPHGPPPKPEIGRAVALYRYAEHGDCTFEVGDSISVYEHMNHDWWLGRNTRTGNEGVFPVSYVQVQHNPPVNSPYVSRSPYNAPTPQPLYQNEKAYSPYNPNDPYDGRPGQYQQPPPGPSNPYNAHVPPMAVAEQPQTEGKSGKAGEMGKKFGSKLGNAAIFGAGATIGGNIVNSIF